MTSIRHILRSSFMRYNIALLAMALTLLFVWPQLWRNLLSTDGFMTHYECYLRKPELLWMHVTSDFLIGMSYVSISLSLAYLVYRVRRDMPFQGIFLAFGLFIIACGGTHFMEVWNTWTPTYWLAGYVKLITAIASVATALILPPLLPKIRAMIHAAKLSEEMRLKLEVAYDELESRVQERTAELSAALESLREASRRREADQQKIRESEERYRSLMLASSQITWTNNAKGEMSGEQPGWAAFTGQSEDEYQNYGWAKAVHPEDRDYTIERWKLAFKNRREFEVEHRLRRHDGVYRTFSVRAVPLFEADGAIREWIGAHVDITEQMQAMRALEESKERFRFMADAMPQIVWTSHPDGNLDYYNQRWYDYTGMTFEQSKDWGWEPILHPDDLQSCIDRWTHSFTTGENFEVEYRFKRADGTYRWHLGRALPMKNPAGELVMWVGTCTDIDDHKIAQEELQKTHEDLELRVARRTSELSSAYHLLEEGISERSRVQEALDKAILRERAMIENALDVICSIDGEGRFVTLSPACFKLWGYHPAELIGRQYSELVLPEDVSRSIDKAASVMSGTETTDFENRYRHKNGWLVDMLWTAFWSDTEQMMFCVARDITERKRAGEALQDSRDYLDHVINAVADPIFVKDRQYRLVLLNDAMCKIMGREYQQLLNTTGYELLPQNEIDIFRQIDERIFTTGEDNVNEENLTDANGITRVIVTRKRLYVDKKGLQYIVGVIRDMTANKQLEEVLKASETLQRQLAQRQSAILDALPAHICLLDHSGKILEVNNEWRQFAAGNEYSGIDFGVGSNYVEICENATGDCDEGAKQAAAMCRNVLSGKSTHAEMEYPCHSPSEKRWFKLTVTPLQKEKSVGAVVMHVNITERKRIESELEEARDLALESVQLKSEFLANMSHEIRTPMNGVIGMTGLLLDSALTDDQREFAETIRSSGESLLTIINDILDFSKIEAGMLSFETLNFIFHHVVEDTVEIFAESAQAKNLELACFIQADVPMYVMGDPGRLRQVLTNLIGNAIKFTEHGEVTVRVTKDQETDSDVSIRFAISDTGIGISPEGQRHLFQAFSQADGSTTRKYGGTGLGLAISRQLVELMDGKISVESVPNQGSTFRFTVRLKKQHNQEITLQPVTAGLEGIKVLIVDNNATYRTILKHQTAAWRMLSVEAADGDEALKLLRAAESRGKAFDIIIVDFLMPGMNGFELARRIKTEAAIAPAQIVLLTSYGQRGHAQRALQAGIAAYLTKPVRQSQLYECLVEVMSETAIVDLRTVSEISNLITRHTLTEHKILRRERILIAEDNTVNQKVLKYQLEKLGYRADVVANGKEALEVISRMPYALVLMDCQMPEMDGFEASIKIRRLKGTPSQTPIIAITANAMKGDREKCLASGMNDYLSKPVNLNELQGMLERWIGGDQQIGNNQTQFDMALVGDEEPGLDKSVLLNLAGEQDDEGQDFVKELIAVYLEDTRRQLTDLRDAMVQGDAQKIGRVAHELKGSSANIGAKQMARLCGLLEQKADDKTDAVALTDQLTSAFERIRLAKS